MRSGGGGGFEKTDDRFMMILQRVDAFDVFITYTKGICGELSSTHIKSIFVFYVHDV